VQPLRHHHPDRDPGGGANIATRGSHRNPAANRRAPHRGRGQRGKPGLRESTVSGQPGRPWQYAGTSSTELPFSPAYPKFTDGFTEQDVDSGLNCTGHWIMITGT
jgi:hypothetical protein